MGAGMLGNLNDIDLRMLRTSAPSSRPAASLPPRRA